MEINGFVVEDGTGLLDSNSYVTIEDSNKYYKLRGFDLWEEKLLTEDTKKAVLVSATLFIDTYYKWAGEVEFSDQALSFPRTGIVYPSNKQPVLGVPSPVKKAVLEAGMKTLKYENGKFVLVDLLPDNPISPIKKIKEKFDVMETDTTYMTAKELGRNYTLYPHINKIIPDYLLKQDLKPLLGGRGWYGGSDK